MGIGRCFKKSALVIAGFLSLLSVAAPESAGAETLRWMRTYNGAGNGWDVGNAVAVAPDGSVYVAGSTFVAGQLYNLLLRKYSADGDLRWMKTYNGAGNDWDYGRGVAVAPDGSVYVAGSTYVELKSENLLLRKYSASGALRWMKINRASKALDHWSGVAAAPDGGVYVAGSTYVAGRLYNLLLSRYSASGDLRWMKTYNGAGNGPDLGTGIAVAPDGSVYVAGTSYVAGQSYNLLLRKYSASGALRWMKTYNGAGNGWDVGDAVAVAPDGSVYVAGSTPVAGQGRNLLLRKYSASGALRWMKTYNGKANGEDLGSGVAVAPDGSVYVAGSTLEEGQRRNLLLCKYSASGDLRWIDTFNGKANGEDLGSGVAVAPDGSVYVAGTSYVEGQERNLLLLKYK